MEEELRHDNAVIPNAPPPAQPTPATPPPPESPNQPPPPAVKRAVRRLGIGDQQSAESSLIIRSRLPWSAPVKLAILMQNLLAIPGIIILHPSKTGCHG